MLNLLKKGKLLLSLVMFLLINLWNTVVVLRGWWIMNDITFSCECLLISGLSVCITLLISTLRNSTLVNNAGSGGGISFFSLFISLFIYFFCQTPPRQMGFVKPLGFRLCCAQQKHVWHKQHAYKLIHFTCRLNDKIRILYVCLFLSIITANVNSNVQILLSDFLCTLWSQLQLILAKIKTPI